MERRKFVRTCSCAALAVPVGISMLSCGSLYYANATRSGNLIRVPIAEFEQVKNGELIDRPFVFVQTNGMAFPICVSRHDGTTYTAVLMRCTHQQCALDVEGEVYACPCHGSTFSKEGHVINGPADRDLETYQTTTNADAIVITLS